MSGLTSALGMSGSLDARLVRPSNPAKAFAVRIPGLGRVILTRDEGSGMLLSRQTFATNLHALHKDGDGQVKGEHDLGSGLVTNVGVTALANDALWAAPSGASAATLALQKWHAVGTGVTAAKATDIALQTLAKPTETEAVEGTQVLVSAANEQKYRTVATTAFTSTLAITEWGLHSAKALSVTTGTPLTAKSATTATVTATPYTASTASVKGEQQLIVEAEKVVACYGLILSNTTGVLTIPAWYKVSDGTAAAEPEATSAIKIKPVLWDHKVFAALNVESGDSVVWTYSLLVASGG